jgi:hypothetical protein
MNIPIHFVVGLKRRRQHPLPWLPRGYRDGRSALRSLAGSGALKLKVLYGDAGWSSPVARQAHNLKVTGSNPVPATNTQKIKPAQKGGLFY